MSKQNENYEIFDKLFSIKPVGVLAALKRVVNVETYHKNDKKFYDSNGNQISLDGLNNKNIEDLISEIRDIFNSRESAYNDDKNPAKREREVILMEFKKSNAEFVRKVVFYPDNDREGIRKLLYEELTSRNIDDILNRLNLTREMFKSVNLN